MGAANYRAIQPVELTRWFRAVNRRLSRLAEVHAPLKIAFRIKTGSKRWRLADLLPAVKARLQL